MYIRFIYASEYKPVLTFAWLVIIMVVIPMYNLSTDSGQLPITCIVILSDSKQIFLIVRQFS